MKKKQIKINFFVFFLCFFIYHPAPSVVVSPSLNVTIKSLINITYIVLYLTKGCPSSLFNISSIGLTLVVSKPVIVSSFFLSISKLKANTAFPLHLISFHKVYPVLRIVFFYFGDRPVKPNIFFKSTS